MTRRDLLGFMAALPVTASVSSRASSEHVRYVGGWGNDVHIVPSGCARYYPGSGGVAAEFTGAATSSIPAVDLGWRDSDGRRVFGCGFGSLW